VTEASSSSGRLRAVLGLVALGATAWFLSAVFDDGSQEVAAARTFTSSSQCKECHAEAFAEWEGSQHSVSWTNPAVRFLSNDFANQDCIDCHAPRPVFVTGMGNRVLPRQERRVEGVDCIACHQLPEEDGGGMAGTDTFANSPCRATAKIELQRVDFCAGCHNQHKTVDQWRDSEWPEKGEDCLSCHMPHRGGDPNAGRDHSFLGGLHMPTLRSAVELRGQIVGGAYQVEVENNGAGHAFPTDERSRAADLFWRVEGSDGWTHLYRIRDPYRHETDIPSTLVHSGETLSLEVPDVPAGAAIEVALFYKRSPYWEDPAAPDPDREATLVHTLMLRP